MPCFIEKRREVSAPVPTLAGEDIAAEATNKGGYKTKEEKRREAEARNRLSRMRSDLKKKVLVMEEKVNRLEGEKAAKEQELCDPEVCKSPGKIRTLNQELRTISRELEGLYENWHGLSQQLDDVDTADDDDF